MADIHPSRKRKLGDIAGTGDAKKSKKFKPGAKGQKRGGPRHAASQTDAADSTSSIKRRIRDLKRLLNHVDSDPTKKMPQTVRIERERELATCEHELAEKLAHKRENDFKNKIIGKYHHIRFFERQKATRIVKRLKKQLADAEDESTKAALEQKIHNAQVDVNYTIYYPLLRPYISLFPNTKKDKTEKAGQSDNDAPADETSSKHAAEPVDGPKGNIDMWKAVEKAMKDGSLQALRDSKEGITMPGPKQPVVADAKAQKTKQASTREPKQEKEKKERDPAAASASARDDEDSDGGFFE